MRETAPGEKYGNGRLGELANLHNAAALITVRRVPGDEGEPSDGKELRQPDQSEVKDAMGERINLPAYGDGGDLISEAG